MASRLRRSVTGMSNMKLFCPRLLRRILLVSGVFSLAGCGPQEGMPLGGPVEVTTFQVTPRDVPISLQYVGQTESSRSVEIRARVEGYLQKKFYDEGMMVRQGDPLFLIEPKPLQLAVESAGATLKDKENLAQNARQTQERMKSLFAENAVSKKDYDDATTAEKSAAAALATSRAEYSRAGLNLSYARITSPLTGLASRANVSEGTYINPASNGLLMTVSQVDPIWVYFSVSENEWLRYDHERKRGTLRFPKDYDFDVEMILADGRRFTNHGKLNFASPSVDTQTGAYAHRASFANPDFRVSPGQFVRVRLNGLVRPNAILVPQRAVMQGQSGKFVYVVNQEHKAEVRPVEVGDWHGDDWFVTSGLKGGEQIVVDGIVKVQPGVPLKIAAETAQAAAPSAKARSGAADKPATSTDARK